MSHPCSVMSDMRRRAKWNGESAYHRSHTSRAWAQAYPGLKLGLWLAELNKVNLRFGLWLVQSWSPSFAYHRFVRSLYFFEALLCRLKFTNFFFLDSNVVILHTHDNNEHDVLDRIWCSLFPPQKSQYKYLWQWYKTETKPLTIKHTPLVLLYLKQLSNMKHKL